ncbi:U-box domain-containing protein 30-like protein [Tanacetum coccineum]
MVDVLNEGSSDTKINCVKLLEVLFNGSEIVPSLRLLVGVLKLVKDRRHPHGILAGLRLLKIISSQESLGSSIISIGGAPQLVEMLPHFNSECLELALYVLGILSSIPEGALALKNCASTIPNLVKLLMKISEICTQYALSILWEICNLSPEESAATAVNAGLAAKLLLVIQSGCNAGLKQRSSELLKLCSLNYTSTIFISKCKLTRTLQ